MAIQEKAIQEKKKKLQKKIKIYRLTDTWVEKSLIQTNTVKFLKFNFI